jgi:hypothetical protein
MGEIQVVIGSHLVASRLNPNLIPSVEEIYRPNSLPVSLAMLKGEFILVSHRNSYWICGAGDVQHLVK